MGIYDEIEEINKEIANATKDISDAVSGKKPKRGTISKTVKNEVLVRQKYKCYRCREMLPARKHFHHKIPVSEGGDNSLGNVIAVCSSCHDEIHHQMQLKKQKKGNREERSIWDMGIEDIY